jgi:hypothetical protein
VSIIPLNKVHRDSIMREAGIHDWYAQAGYTVEFDEYSIEPERKGEAVKEGRRLVFRVISLDLEYEDDEGRESTLWDQVDRADEWYDTLPEDFDPDLARIGRKAGLTKKELAAVAWVMEGNTIVSTEYNTHYTERLAEAIGSTREGARKAWTRARSKITDAWT